ncbi:sigma-54 dependent transcriptional regulator [uncultured Desulfobacter sp.]|uniref:sigma-54 dependent transcriptional regulator n=1 Tax=uncultured Desulfobacter sp. TaxID=240139 RepID=UPI002AAC2D8C|nr:sigma-54 dependent transcriptional regulator [uncultured Desulfobacter sp.]
MITAFGSVDTAVSVMKLGADDFIEKPVDLKELLDRIRRIEQQVIIEEEAAEIALCLDNTPLPLRIIGDGPAMKKVLSLVRRIAPTEWTALIHGETGCGKELIARLIHLLSPRQNQPFIEVNCAAIPENLFESELFGHEKGAFTGASGQRKGRFELADKGVLFLDEIGELSMTVQAKLLRALQEKRIQRVGGNKLISADVRVLAATNRDLKQMVLEGRFREDLFYRINVLDVELPPLRHRREDIPELAKFFIQRYSPREMWFDADALATLLKYNFPGNVRELEHMIQRMTTLSRGPVLRTADLPVEVRFHKAADAGGSLSERLDAVEREMVVSALEKHQGIQTQAAASLGISERVLRYKMKKHGLQNPVR